MFGTTERPWWAARVNTLSQGDDIVVASQAGEVLFSGKVLLIGTNPVGEPVFLVLCDDGHPRSFKPSALGLIEDVSSAWFVCPAENQGFLPLWERRSFTELPPQLPSRLLAQRP